MNGIEYKKPKRNLNLRGYVSSMGVSWKEIAQQMFVAPSTLSEWLTKEMPRSKQMEIVQAVKAIKLLKGEVENEEV